MFLIWRRQINPANTVIVFPVGMPAKLIALRDLFLSMKDRNERIQMLIDIASGFKPVPEDVATRPFDEKNRVPHCESEAFVWAVPRPDKTLKFYFAVENPQGISARATAAILDKTLSGALPEEVAAVPGDVIYEIFGSELSMGKNMGLTGMLNMCKAAALQQIARNGANGS
jgi:cysteine desulfuration protein SufE